MTESLTGKSQTNTLKSDSVDDSADEKAVRHEKRLAQHEHWMRVMMEGQSTPDLRYQRPKRSKS